MDDEAGYAGRRGLRPMCRCGRRLRWGGRRETDEARETFELADRVEAEVHPDTILNFEGFLRQGRFHARNLHEQAHGGQEPAVATSARAWRETARSLLEGKHDVL